MHLKTANPAAQGAPTGLGKSQCLAACVSEIAQSLSVDQAKIPSRAPLARRWPGLRLNRYTGRWLDEASGAHGDDFASLSRYLEEAR